MAAMLLALAWRLHMGVERPLDKKLGEKIQSLPAHKWPKDRVGGRVAAAGVR